MMVLLDANLLLRTLDVGHPHRPIARAALRQLQLRGRDIVLVPQVLYEYWAAATRPLEQNGMGADISATESNIVDWMRVFRRLLDERGVYLRWRDLVNSYQVIR